MPSDFLPSGRLQEFNRARRNVATDPMAKILCPHPLWIALLASDNSYNMLAVSVSFGEPSYSGVL